MIVETVIGVIIGGLVCHNAYLLCRSSMLAAALHAANLRNDEMLRDCMRMDQKVQDSYNRDVDRMLANLKPNSKI